MLFMPINLNINILLFYFSLFLVLFSSRKSDHQSALVKYICAPISTLATRKGESNIFFRFAQCRVTSGLPSPQQLMNSWVVQTPSSHPLHVWRHPLNSHGLRTLRQPINIPSKIMQHNEVYNSYSFLKIRSNVYVTFKDGHFFTVNIL